MSHRSYLKSEINGYPFVNSMPKTLWSLCSVFEVRFIGHGKGHLLSLCTFIYISSYLKLSQK